jgi:pSer/pThr/pTyr-binding forkhead associated (FHA) protein
MDGLSTASIAQTDSAIGKPEGGQFPPAPVAATEARISLHIVRTGQILPLIGRDEFTIGRVSEGQSILPDIDLTPYEAYSQGVSRLHATIKIMKDRVSVTDLGSSNGTRINQTKLSPNKEYKLNHGDVISLGKFKIQALIRQDD